MLYGEFRRMIKLAHEYDFLSEYAINHGVEFPNFETFEQSIYDEMAHYIKRVQFSPTKMLELVDFLNEYGLPDIDRDGFEQVTMVAKRIVDECVSELKDSVQFNITKDIVEDDILYAIKYDHKIFCI